MKVLLRGLRAVAFEHYPVIREVIERRGKMPEVGDEVVVQYRGRVKLVTGDEIEVSFDDHAQPEIVAINRVSKR